MRTCSARWAQTIIFFQAYNPQDLENEARVPREQQLQTSACITIAQKPCWFNLRSHSASGSLGMKWGLGIRISNYFQVRLMLAGSGDRALTTLLPHFCELGSILPL